VPDAARVSLRPAARRLPWLTPLVVIGVLAAVVAGPAPPVRPVAYAPAGKPFCLVDTHIPDEAYRVEEFVRTHNYSPPPGLKGGRPYNDDGHALPPMLRPLKEYDVYPAVPGDGRPSPRIVLSNLIPYASWYSPNHYDNFLLMFPVGCLVDPTRWLSLPGGGR
jgi:hypothetical protein